MINPQVGKVFAIAMFIFALIVMLLGLFTSCAPSNGEIPKSTDNVMYFPSDLGSYAGCSVRHGEYKGHKYLIFGVDKQISIVHDPDCPCQKKKSTSDSMFDW